jgi:hypothetical protein
VRCLPHRTGNPSAPNTAPSLPEEGIEHYCDQPEQDVTRNIALHSSCRGGTLADTGCAPAQLHCVAPDYVRALPTSAALSAQAAFSSLPAPETERTYMRVKLGKLHYSTWTRDLHSIRRVTSSLAQCACAVGGGRREGGRHALTSPRMRMMSQSTSHL